jgi:hypothetical protein
MQKRSIIARVAAAVVAAFLVVALTSVSGFAASDFEGVWTVEDTQGKAFRIRLSAAGKARAKREGEKMKGSWKDEDGTAVITWDSGWTTKIMKDGDTYKKVAFEKGAPLDGTPTNTSPAKKMTPKKKKKE